MFARLFGRARTRTTATTRKPAAPRFGPQLEVLEGREVPAVFVVNSDADLSLSQLIAMGVPTDPQTSNPLVTTLRSAIELSNATDDGTTNVIYFGGTPSGSGGPPGPGEPVSTEVPVSSVTTIGGVPVATYGAGSSHTITLDHALGTLSLTRDAKILNTSGATITVDAAASATSLLRHLTVAGTVAEFEIDSLRFVNGWADGDGGAIIAPFTKGTLKDTSFVGNKAQGSGGALSLGGDTTLVNCRFQFCVAAGSGGAVYSPTTVSRLVIRDSEFDSNEANSSGGAVEIQAVSCLVEGSTFYSNQAVIDDGGALHFLHAAGNPPAGVAYFTLHIVTSYFQGNVAGKGGGAIGQQGADMALAIDCSDFIYNVAATGGAVYCSGAGLTCRLAVDGCSFSFNSAVNGGAISNSTSSHSTYSGCQFWWNSAESNGGALLCKTGHHRVAGCEFDGNTAGGSGNSICYTGNPSLAPPAAGWLVLDIDYNSCPGLLPADVQGA